jgi:hypothetical protein
MEAWEGNPGGVRASLADPRCERHIVHFLDLSGVGRTMADGTDEDGARAARMDEAKTEVARIFAGGRRRKKPKNGS